MKTYSLILPEDEMRSLKVEAAKRGLSMKAFIMVAIREKVERESKPGQPKAK